jgi:MFS family permease
MSEAYGRKLSILVPVFGLMVFSFSTAASKAIQTLLITRFFGGVFGSAPLCNVAAAMADIWHPTQRGAALLLYGLAVLVGPLVAPIVGGALVVNLTHTGWRWTEYVSELSRCSLTC